MCPAVARCLGGGAAGPKVAGGSWGQVVPSEGLGSSILLLLPSLFNSLADKASVVGKADPQEISGQVNKPASCPGLAPVSQGWGKVLVFSFLWTCRAGQADIRVIWGKH